VLSHREPNFLVQLCRAGSWIDFRCLHPVSGRVFIIKIGVVIFFVVLPAAISDAELSDSFRFGLHRNLVDVSVRCLSLVREVNRGLGFVKRIQCVPVTVVGPL